MKPWQIALLVVLLVVFEVVPAVIAMKYNGGLRVAASCLPAAPPPIVFAVVWPILYALTAAGLWFQCTSTKPVAPGIQWTGVALLAAQLVVSFAWTPVFSSGKTRAATWMIVAMLLTSLPGLLLATQTSTTAGALWAPYVAWLIFALILSAQAAGNACRTNSSLSATK